MKLRYSKRALYALEAAPRAIRKAFYKQAAILLVNRNHPFLHAKKYSEAEGKWQARINRSWRF